MKRKSENNVTLKELLEVSLRGVRALKTRLAGTCLAVALLCVSGAGDLFAAKSAQFAQSAGNNKNIKNNKKNKHQTRAVSSLAALAQVGGTTAYNPASETLFVGADVGNADSSLASAQLNPNIAPYTEAVNPFAPTPVTKNGTAGALNPLNAVVVNKVAFNGTSVVATVPAVGVNTSKDTVVLVPNPAVATTIFTNEVDLIKDANNIGLAVGDEYAALAASNTDVFLAVPVSAGAFGAANSGFVRLQQNPGAVKANELDVVKPASGLFAGATAAYELDLASYDTGGGADYVAANNTVQAIASDITGAASAGKLAGVTAADMYWDDKMQRLFIGLSAAVTSLKNPAVVESVLVGNIGVNPQTGALAANQMFLQQAVPFLQTSITTPLLNDGSDDGANNSIIGAIAADLTVIQSSAFKVRTMHTSTGKSYMVVNGGVDADTRVFASKVFAIPIVNSGTITDGTNGLIARADDAVTLLDDLKEATVADSGKAVVGVNFELISQADGKNPVVDMSVVGDTVYVAVAGDRVAPGQENGVFASTALFNADGLVNGWTPWERATSGVDAVVADVNAVQGFGVGTEDANIQFLTSTDGLAATGFKSAKSTAWGTSADVTANSRALDVSLEDNAVFGATGVERVFNFGTATPGFFKPLGGAAFAMDVAVGGNTVALIQTVQNATNNNANPIDSFDPTVNANVLIVRNGTGNADLAAIQPLTCAEVSRFDDNNPVGFVYVGGANGMARLQADGTGAVADGDGWTADTAGGAGLDTFNEAGVSADDHTIGTDFNFVKVNDWNGRFVQTIAAEGTGNLWVLAIDKLAKTDDTGTSIVGNINNFGGAQLGFDLVVVNPAAPLAIYATTSGLFATTDATAANTQQIEGDDTTQPTMFADNLIPVQLAYLSPTTGINANLGNLLVLVSDPQQVLPSKIYRFFVDTTVPSVELVSFAEADAITLDAFYRYFALNGGVSLAARSDAEAIGQRYLEVIDGNNLTAALDVGTGNVFTNVPVKDSATGGWVVPGDWGVRVQE